MSEWLKTTEVTPNTSSLVEVKSDYFSNGKNYAALIDTKHWLYFDSDPTNNEGKIIPFGYVSEWRWIKIEKISKELEEVKKIIKEHFNEANCGLFFCKNTAGDEMTNIYDKNGIQIDICYNCQYFEVFGLDLVQQVVLERYYNYFTLKRHYDVLEYTKQLEETIKL